MSNSPYTTTAEECEEQCKKFRENYPKFTPFLITKDGQERIIKNLQHLISFQDGQDFDDYMVIDGGKVKKYTEFFSTKGTEMLLLGVGSGREILAAESLGYNAYGTTLGSRNVAFAKCLGVNSDKILREINEALPFQDCSFDIVCGFQVFEHTISPSMFLLETARVLKNNGHVVLEWPFPSEQTGGSSHHHQICFTPGQALALLDKAGFCEIKAYYSNLDNVPEELYWCGNKKCHNKENKKGKNNFVIHGRKSS